MYDLKIANRIANLIDGLIRRIRSNISLKRDDDLLTRKHGLSIPLIKIFRSKFVMLIENHLSDESEEIN